MTTLGLVNLNARYQKVSRGESAECKIHGLHDNWRICKNRISQCRLCNATLQRKSREKYPIKFLLRDAKQHAKQRKREFDLCEQDIIDQLFKQNNNCAISGLSFSKYKISLDRIDSNKGYTKDNIQLLTIQVNRMKSDFEVTDFIDVCKQITKFNGDK